MSAAIQERCDSCQRSQTLHWHEQTQKWACSACYAKSPTIRITDAEFATWARVSTTTGHDSDVGRSDVPAGELACWTCRGPIETPVVAYGAIVYCSEACRNRNGHDAKAARWRQIFDRLELRGLRPIWDPLLHVIRIDCPDCHAQDGDPLGLYRPVVIRRRHGVNTLDCDQCGVHRAF